MRDALKPETYVGAADRIAGFARVRGTFEDNSVVKDIKKHIEDKTKLGDELIRRMQKIH